MRPEELTPYHRADLEAREAAARARVEAATVRARDGAAAGVASDPEDTRLWNAMGHWAMLFCIWFVFIAPIVLVLLAWD